MTATMRHLLGAALAVAVLAPGALGQQPPGPPSGSGPPGGAGAPSADQIASQACSNLESKMGADAFAKKFGSQSGCVGKVAPIAQQAIQQCQSASDKRTCVQAALQEGIKKLVGGGSVDTGKIADQASTQICEKAKEKAGGKYPGGSLAACKPKIQADVEQLAKSAAEKCKSASDKKACIQEQLKTLLQSGKK